MKETSYRKLVQEYFDAEERGDVGAVVELCDPRVVIRNAAQPPAFGKEGVRKYVSDFKERTEERKFDILTVAAEDKVVFAWWNAELTFKQGVTFGTFTTRRAFIVKLQGVCRFKFSEENRFLELDVFHETTTPFLMAQQAAT